MFKRLVAVATATMLTIAMSVSAFAAVTAEQKNEILAELTKNGVSTSDDIYKEVSKTLDDPKMELTADDVSTVKSQISVVREEVRKLNKDGAGIKSYADLKKAVANTPALANTVTSALETAAKAVGITDVKITLTGDKPVISYKSPSGVSYSIDVAAAAPSSAKIENTGVDFSTTAAVVAGLGLSVAGIAVIARKKDLVNA